MRHYQSIRCKDWICVARIWSLGQHHRTPWIWMLVKLVLVNYWKQCHRHHMTIPKRPPGTIPISRSGIMCLHFRSLRSTPFFDKFFFFYALNIYTQTHIRSKTIKANCMRFHNSTFSITHEIFVCTTNTNPFIQTGHIPTRPNRTASARTKSFYVKNHQIGFELFFRCEHFSCLSKFVFLFCVIVTREIFYHLFFIKSQIFLLIS